MGGDQTKISVQDYEILNDLYCYDQNNLNKKFYPLKNPYKEISIDDLKKQAGFKNIFVNAYQAFKAEFLLKRKNEENEILKKELINSENSKHELKNEIEYLKSMLNLKEKEINNKIEQEEMIYKSKIYEIEAKIKTDYRITEKDNYCFKNLNSYDMVIAVTSLNDLKVSKGWKISFINTNSFDYKNSACAVVGVIGIFNKGKSFILQKLSGQKISQGFSVNTEGLSIKFPIDKDYPLTILDTAGFETPIKKTTDFVDEKIVELLKDRAHTEVFLQKYIINNSNVLIIVVGILTLSDQKLINRLKNLASEKKLLIVHNLLTFTEVEEVEGYVEKTLKESFNLTEHVIMKINHNDGNKNYYWLEQVGKEEVVHLVLAKEGSNAGSKYNDSTFLCLKSKIISYTERKIFDPIEAMRNQISESSREIFESSIIEKIKNKEKIVFKDDKIYLDDVESIKLTNCFFDEQGVSIFKSSGFTPEYSIFKTKNKKLEIYIDVPDLDLEKNNLKISPIETRGPQYELIIKGKKIEKFEDNILMIDNRKKGEFTVTLKISKESLNFSKLTPSNFKYVNGVMIIYYDLVSDQPEEFDILSFISQN